MIVKKALNKYFEAKYGKVFASKPPIGFLPDSNPKAVVYVKYWFRKMVWKIDSFIVCYAGSERKRRWLFHRWLA